MTKENVLYYYVGEQNIFINSLLIICIKKHHVPSFYINNSLCSHQQKGPPFWERKNAILNETIISITFKIVYLLSWKGYFLWATKKCISEHFQLKRWGFFSELGKCIHNVYYKKIERQLGKILISAIHNNKTNLYFSM